MTDEPRQCLQGSLFASTSPFAQPDPPTPSAPAPVTSQTTLSPSQRLAKIAGLIEEVRDILTLDVPSGEVEDVMDLLEAALELARKHA